MSKKVIYFTGSEIISKFIKTTEHEKVIILLNALDCLKANPTYSIATCIALAMGYDFKDPKLYNEILYHKKII